ncbi:MAG: hypothetical protein MUF30_13880 [Burkholderiales bacterium]|nr:hypothetical protein [Burkholderiales bacterium]
MSPTLRRAVLGLALVGTGAAVWAVSGDPADDVGAPRRAPRTAPTEVAPRIGSIAAGSDAGAAVPPARGERPATARATGPLDLARARRTLPDAPVADVFGARSWDPPPRRPSARELAARPPAPPPAPPQAPPLPFGYVGMLGDGDTTTVFLSRGEATLAATVGATVDGQYRIDAVDDRAVHLTYLPLDQRQSLSIVPSP